MELHIDLAHARRGIGHLGLEGEVDPFVRLDTDREVFCEIWGSGGMGNMDMGRLFEDDGDGRRLLGQHFAGTQVERHALPAPVVDEKRNGGDRWVSLNSRPHPLHRDSLRYWAAHSVLAAPRPA